MYNILICDDEKDIVSAIEIYLKTAGYSVYKAYNGMEAVDMVNSNDIQLVLMDVMMPQMDGITAMAKIRESSMCRLSCLRQRVRIPTRCWDLRSAQMTM